MEERFESKRNRVRRARCPKETGNEVRKRTQERTPQANPSNKSKVKPKKEVRKETQEKKERREISPNENMERGQLSTTKTRVRVKRLINRLKNPAPSTTVPHDYKRIHPRRSLLVYIHRSLVPCLCNETLSVAIVDHTMQKSVPYWAIAHRSQRLSDLTIPPSSSSSSASASEGSQQG